MKADIVPVIPVLFYTEYIWIIYQQRMGIYKTHFFNNE